MPDERENIDPIGDHNPSPSDNGGRTVGGDEPGAAVENKAAVDLTAAMPQTVNTPRFVGYPLTKYHPVYGGRTVGDPNEAASIFTPAHDWWPTPGEADMHRTDREAQQVIHHNRSVKVDDKLAIAAGGEGDLPSASPERKGIVRNSVQAQMSVDSGALEIL